MSLSLARACSGVPWVGSHILFRFEFCLSRNFIQLRDSHYNQSAVRTFADVLHQQFPKAGAPAPQVPLQPATAPAQSESAPAATEVLFEELEREESGEPSSVDMLGEIQRRSVHSLRADNGLRTRMENSGVPWGELNSFVLKFI